MTRLLISVDDVAVDDVETDDNIRLFDCRFSLADPLAGQQQYREGHLPGALHADLEDHLSSPAGERGRHPLPDRHQLEAQFQVWGIKPDTHIVCYDEGSSAQAGRLWWLARWLGHANVSILDGGMAAWVSAGKPLSQELPEFARSQFTAGEPLTRQVEASDINPSKQCVIDARDAARFRGEVEPIDRIAGHIPGAINAPFTGNLSGGRFDSAASLGQRFASLGVDKTDDIVCYCGSGVTAIHNMVALMAAGYPEPALYPGSWSEWINHPDRPIATGE